MNRSSRVAWAALATIVPAIAGARAADAQGEVAHIPLERGLAVVQALHGPDFERESLVLVEDASAAGARYLWRGVETNGRGDTIRVDARRFVSAADLASAPQLHIYFDPHGPGQQPGYTSFSISTALYQQLRAAGSAPVSIMSSESPAGAMAGLGALGGGGQDVPVRWRGTLVRVSPGTLPFSLLMDGRRVTVPALHLRGPLAARDRTWPLDLWVLADSAHPLLLRMQKGENVLQTVRVERTEATAASGAAMEHALDASCRVELPGIYFESNSAALDPASERTVAAVAGVLARHPAWTTTIEGHTDSIGGAAANQMLSTRRAEAVRLRLVAARGVAAGRLRAIGYGQTKPRESNATIEGRARNRRVELVRECGKAT